MKAQLGDLDHIDIVVRDTEKTAQFLETLGFARIRSSAERGSVELRLPGGPTAPLVELTPAVPVGGGAARPLGMRHLAFRSTALDALHAEMVATGLNVDGPPKDVVATGRRLFNFTDPDGAILQVVSAD